MPELIGRTLGQYRIIEQIGQGGMATVYKAYQPGLDRDVALKILPPFHAKQPGFSERFRREAKAIAHLHHPNILPVYDSGQDGEYSYLAMRYIDGARTLADVMCGPLTMQQVSHLISQIAAALSYAHRQGVLHRDVKPSNILMDGDWALLTDFGLAKMTEASVKLTGTGVGIGTPAYMSPEQGQGKAVDHRTDIYALGVILYEMLTGQIPHNAETPIGIIVKRMSEPLPLPHTLNPAVTEPVERVILKALAADPADRFDDAEAMAAALRAAIAGSRPGDELQTQVSLRRTGDAPPPVSRRKWLLGAVAVVLVVGVIAFGLGRGSGSVEPVERPTATAVAASQTGSAPPPTVALPGGPLSIGEVSCWTNPNSLETEPAWSPDGEKLLFVSNRDGNREIYKMNADGVTNRLTNNPASDRQPVWSPKGDKLAFASDRAGDWEIYVLDAQGVVTRLTNNPASEVEPAWSPRTDKLAFASDRDGDWEIYTLDAEGKARSLTNNQVEDREPAWSSDGSKLAFASNRDGNWEIYILGADGQAKRMTNNPAEDREPAWSPDGSRLTFVSDRDGDREIYWLGPTGQTQQITDNASVDENPAWASDGTRLSFVSNQTGNQEICTVTIGGQ